MLGAVPVIMKPPILCYRRLNFHPGREIERVALPAAAQSHKRAGNISAAVRDVAELAAARILPSACTAIVST